MKSNSIIMLVVGASLASLILSVFFSITFVEISPKNLARVIEKDPYVFMEAVRKSSQKYQKIAEEKALEEEEGRIEKELEDPKKIDTKNRVTFGPSNAPVTIVEFSDFQCPYCAKASTRLKSVIKKYEGKVNVVYKNFPLSFHPFAKPAANYFEAIALIDKGKARDFHDFIFDDFSRYARIKESKEIQQALNTLVRKVKVPLSQVQKNIPQAEKTVEQDMKEAERLQVRGTPSFFVNGVNPGRKDLEEVIDLVLQKL